LEWPFQQNACLITEGNQAGNDVVYKIGAAFAADM
jgi:hypothetical protein